MRLDHPHCLRAGFIAAVLSLAGSCSGGDSGQLSPDGGSDGPGGGGSPGGDAALPCGTLRAVMRDFSHEHPDFERDPGGGAGIVTATIGSDRKPVYAHAGPYLTVSSPASFAQWYNGVDGVNERFEIVLPLVQDGATFRFESAAFFPLDGMGLGDQCAYPICATHNFHFTTEIHATFEYKGGEVFNFTGDDDVFVFINDHLVIDLGGIHDAHSAAVNLDASAAALGLTLGGTYAIDFFHAERRVTQSNFMLETTIECLESPPVS